MKGLRGLVILLSVLLFLAVGGVVAVFLMRNEQWVAVRFPVLQLDWSAPFAVSEWETPLYVVMLVCTVVGALLVSLLFLPLGLRRMVQRSRDRRFISSLEGELTELRNLPVTSPAPLEDIAEDPAGAGGDRSKRAKDDEDEDELMALLQEPNGPAGGKGFAR